MPNSTGLECPKCGETQANAVPYVLPHATQGTAQCGQCGTVFTY